jgi:hypothetical protein
MVDYDKAQAQVLLRKILIVCDGDMASQNDAIRQRFTVGQLIDWRKEALKLKRKIEQKG